MVINDEPKVMGKFDQLNYIEIWAPRYNDQRILINPSKVGQDNKLVFTKAPSLPHTYYLSGKTIKKYKKESNGTIMCFSVPVAELRPLLINNKDLREVI